jgi:hypothetical protein
MKKKLIVVTALTTVLLGGTALTISANHNGYELYKTALKNTHTLASAETSIESTVQVNGQIYQHVEMDAKYNLEQKAVQSSINIQLHDKTEKLGLFLQNGQFYIDNGQQTYAIESSKKEHPYPDKDFMKIAETIIDTLTTPLHDHFKIDGDTVTVALTSQDIPTVFRQIGEYMVKKGTSAHEHATMSPAEYPFLTEELSASLPVLTDNIHIDSLLIKAELTEDHFLESQQMTLNVSGEDKNGEVQPIQLDFNMKITNMNETQLEHVTLDSNIIPLPGFKGAHH